MKQILVIIFGSSINQMRVKKETNKPLKGRDILELYYIQISNKPGKKNVSQSPFTMTYGMHTEYQSVNFVEGPNTNTRLLRTN